MISANNVTLRIGKKALFEDVNIKFTEGNCYGLIGANGAGKSTFLKILTGQIEPSKGDVSITPGQRLSFLEQDHFKYDEYTVLDTVIMGNTRLYEIMKEKEAIYAKEDFTEEDGNKASELEAEFADMNGWEAESDAAQLLNGLGITTDLHYKLMSELNGSEKVKVLLAKALFGNPDILLLDEPTNHLDLDAIAWLEEFLINFENTVIVVSHDRYFLNRLCTSICEIEHGVLTRYKGDYSAYTVQKEAAVIRQTKEYELQQKEIAKLEDYIARNQTRASTAKSAQSRMKQLEKMERIEKPITYQKSARVQFTYDIEPPQQVLQVQDIAIAVGSGAERKVLAKPVSFEVRRGEKWGIIGENGVGKSTLLKILQGQLPHVGKIRWAAQTKISYFEQESTNLHPAKTVMQEIHDRVPTWLDYDVRSLLGKVRITGEEVYKQVGVLSGGERAKVCFAVMMLEHGNILILDEPTNHLDISMKEVIEDAMKTFTGTILFVSHDRYLLDQVADHILEIKPTGVKTYIGGFQSWLDATKKEAAAANAAAQAVETEKKKEDKQQTYRSKEQRAKAAQQRARMRQLEQQSEAMQAELDALNEEITKEEVYSDFNLMQEKCKRMDTLRTELDAALEEMILLEEELG